MLHNSIIRQSFIINTFEIHDISGKTIQVNEMTATQDQITVVTQDWNARVYIATIKIDGKSIESVKFTLIK